ncbi:uncharacterized protein LOC135836516 isoform X2 [Planococcus citri]|uniref:uncharacterized protein LOC135836516 isoform X2 n=1 Tax=Planococcus citri TaxID=170843 RepID=UPI0031F9F1E8
MACEKLNKMSGYLEKRGKMSIMGRWKKWWCVLEGQLLLYYKSRIEYTNLSPCCGSLNMALVKNVQPHRTKNKDKQQQWFHALVGVLPQNSYLSPILYFATNSIEYRRKSQRKKKKSKHKEFVESIKAIEHEESSSFSQSDNNLSNLANESNFSLSENHTSTEIENISTNQENLQVMTTRISTSLECNLQKNTCADNTLKCRSEVNIRKYSSYRSIINAVSINERITNRRSMSCECIFAEFRTSSVEEYNFLSSCSIQTHSDEGSQENSVNSGDSQEPIKYKPSCRRKRKNDSNKYNTLGKKSFSFLKKIFKKRMEIQNLQSIEPIENDCSTEVIEEKHDTKSMTSVAVEENILESNESDIKEINTIQTIENDETAQSKIEEITPCNNFVEQNTTNASSNNEIEAESSDTDTESSVDASENIQEEEKLPDLPIKNGHRTSYTYHDFKDRNSNYPIIKITTPNDADTKESISFDNSASMELDSLLLQLNVLNTQCDKSHESLEFHNNIIEDPDYDIPRPHTSLISDSGSTPSIYEKQFLEVPRKESISNQKFDSLSIDMAPDSLEMPWLLNDVKSNMHYWTTKKEFDLCSENDSGSEYDYHDSLNSNKYNS